MYIFQTNNIVLDYEKSNVKLLSTLLIKKGENEVKYKHDKTKKIFTYLIV